MPTTSNSTLARDSASSGAIKVVLVVTVPVVIALSVAIILALVLRACWRKRKGSKEYIRIPTTDEHPESKPQVKRKVQVAIPDPPPPKTRITLATDITKSSSKYPRYLPYKAAATGEERIPGETVGVAVPQAFLCLTMVMNDNRLMVEVQSVVGLPCRADGTPVHPFVKLHVVSREKKHVNRRASTVHPIAIDPDFMQTVDCGSVAREDLEHCILHIEVLDYWTLTHHVLATGDLRLDQVKEKPTKSFKVPLSIIKLGAVTFSGHVLISLCYDKATSKFLVTIPKVELSLDSLPLSTDYWIKVIITKGEKCLVKEKVKHVLVVLDEIHFNKSIVCHDVSDITSLSVQCSLVTMTTVNFMRRPKVLGTVTLGSHEQGQALRHWNDMLNTLNTPIAEWHDLT